MRLLIPFLCIAISCGGDAPETPTSGQDKCPQIAVDELDGRWVRVAGSAGDTTHRFEVKRTSDGGYNGTFILGSFDRIATTGVAHQSMVVFTETLSGSQLKEYNSGKRLKRQLHIEPRLKSCSLRVTQVALQKQGGNETERNIPGKDEYLPFPDGQPFSFHTCDGPLFIGKAALKSKVANWEMNTHGSPNRSHQLGKKLPLGVWTDSATDGDPSCQYDMDLWFDDRPVKDKTAIQAGKVIKGKRHWLVKEWFAPYSGNHHFMVERYRTCNGQRERIGINCLDAVLSP